MAFLRASAPSIPAWKRWLLAIVIATAGLLANDLRLKRIDFSYQDQATYLSLAGDLLQRGRFTDGVFGSPAARADKAPGMFLAPLFPALAAGVAALDPTLRTTVACAAARARTSPPDCPADLGLLLPLQMAIAAATLLLVWRSAAAVTRSETVAWVALLIASFGTPLLSEYAHLGETENLTFLFFAAFSLALLKAVERGGWVIGAIGGACLGLAVLTRPAFLYLGIAVAAACAIAILLEARKRSDLQRHRWRDLAAASLIFGLVLAPWIARNALVFGTPAITANYGGFIFTQRIAYDAMTPKEYAVGWVRYFPTFGNFLAHLFFPPEASRRLDDYEPDSFYSTGNAEADPLFLEASAPSPDHQVGPLLRDRVLPDLGKFTLVTLLLAWRGFWIGNQFGLICGSCLIWRLSRIHDPAWPPLAILSAPPLFMLLFQAAVSVSVSRYNIILLPVMAIAAAQVCVDLWQSRAAHKPVAAAP